MKTIYFLFLILIVPSFCSGQITASASASATIMRPQIVGRDSSGNIFISGDENQFFSAILCDSLFTKNDSSKIVVLLQRTEGIHSKNPKKIFYYQENPADSRRSKVNIFYE